MSSLSSFLRSTALAVVATLSCAPAFGTVVTYSSQATFLAAIQAGSYTEDFTRAGDAIAADSFAFPDFGSGSGVGSGFAYTVSSDTHFGPSFDGQEIYLGNDFVGNNYQASTLRVTFTSGSPTAIGGNFFLTDVDNNSLSGFIAITLYFAGGTSQALTPINVVDATTYTGYISTLPITALVMSVAGDAEYHVIDNFTVGQAALTVPEPATYALLAGGLMALALTRRRRQS